ncbi:protein abnormal spindle-like [Zerene cesonia]|uniref:protein abnormal spindle-like n=1 Tax=Zerene cesonia TaxID=33412 RepID=UPI0018E59E40|nr:protein abnormal spindle-like [Zerene cesonia]
MYFQIENTPEHVKRARRAKKAPPVSPKEECPRLILAPFSRPPQVVFDNVLIGSSCEKYLEVFNPSKQVQQITLNKALPPGLIIELPGEWLVLEPETCYCLSMVWSPTQPIALRETIRFTNENRGRYDVIVVLKSVMAIKAKTKGFKTSPGKIKKKSLKKSPVNITKKKVAVIYNTTQIKKTINVVQSTKYKVLTTSSETFLDHRPASPKCPFDSPNSVDIDFNTSEIFSNVQNRTAESFLQKTYDKPVMNDKLEIPKSYNVLKPSNKQTFETSASDIFDNITFTPLKSAATKNEKLNNGPKIVLSIPSESDYDDSLDIKDGNKENETHSIICITSTHLTNNRWLTVDSHTKLGNTEIETPKIVSKKIPNTSSPKELNSPNFSINTDFSRISDLSFFPPRFSTERKMFPKINNDTHDIIDDHHMKLSSDTYTKDSPNTPFEYHVNQIESRQCYPLKEQNQRMCRQALFREQDIRDYNERNFVTRAEHNSWQNDLRMDIRSPPRSITPPLQSIPEESVQFSDTHTFDRTNQHMDTFSVNRTYNKHEKTVNRQTAWSKKAVVKSKILPLTRASATKINSTFDANKSNATNVTLNYIPNVYSQSLTVDPFLSTTYFYDESLIQKFERDFKRWLNYILTPPDLDSNVEQKIDVGKAWIENRNKEIPTAPTREKVCNVYHNSHRLESLRKSARTLLKTPEISQVLLKLNAQIDKKLIAIRDDRNLHLDIGLQKTIMEIILSYNPLWLRIGLEAIYGVILPLKSNSDIEGLTLFIIQRMFKNPFLKNKHSKSTAPNMLLPAYIEAIKKFSLKKFFMLVFFLDQAKQKKLISHDPCLFCRNAICKESRQIIIRFTRELIAGIGDITKHLRPLGYVVVHKQTYLDEYKYGVNDIAIDLRDGVRLTKVSEIILMRDNLLSQLRAPAVSRLQKIHNVEVALKALRGANFKIEGEITSTDIADGHREKTLSLLWQLIHVFRAPLFERAANVIQIWWKKKYEVIAEKKRVEEEILRKRIIAAEIIQYWWRRIQYKRMYEKRLYEVTCAVITLQKFCRMWLCRSRLRKYKTSVLKIERWYTDLKLIREAKEILRSKREERRHKCAVLIQAYVRRCHRALQTVKLYKEQQILKVI